MKLAYACSQCKSSFRRRMGRCPSCNSWGTLSETAAGERPNLRVVSPSYVPEEALKPRAITDIDDEETERMPCGIESLDDVLGGGIVSGSLVLFSGDPGIGKSTLLLQMLHALSEEGVETLYLSAEESEGQIAERATRISCKAKGLYVASLAAQGGNTEEIARVVRESDASVIVIDSLQTLRCPGVTGQPGGVNHVRESTLRMMNLAKDPEDPVTIFLVCHVTKDGDIAGPKTVAHMVDTVVWFEGQEDEDIRYLSVRGKNRFGPGNIRRVFRMTEKEGLVDLGESERETPKRPAAKRKKR